MSGKYPSSQLTSFAITNYVQRYNAPATGSRAFQWPNHCAVALPAIIISVRSQLNDDGEAQEDFFDPVEDKTHFMRHVKTLTQLSYTKYGVHKTV